MSGPVVLLIVVVGGLLFMGALRLVDRLAGDRIEQVLDPQWEKFDKAMSRWSQ